MKCPYCGSDKTVGNVIPHSIDQGIKTTHYKCKGCGKTFCQHEKEEKKNDPVNAPSHYIGKIECIDYLRDKLTKEEFTGFCMGNVLKYSSRWRKKDGLQDLKKAKVYLDWAIENEEKE